MSENTLYNKYRPNKLSDVVGQNHIKQYFENAILQNKIGHAYMLSGTRGCGKTTLSRIIALMVNCENGPNINYDINSKICKSIIDGNCPDVHEIDAASNTSIDNMREIRSLARNVPVMCKKRIFIIDEVHALASKAIGALLKTLEEPPEHAIFILATTDPQNVIETIRSRCQQFDLKKITDSDIVDRLKYICESENVQYDENAIGVIASAGNGSLRDSISTLEKVIVGKKTDKIELEDVSSLVGVGGQKFYLNLLRCMLVGKYAESITLVKEETAKGTTPEIIFSSLLENTHCMMLNKIYNDYEMFYIEDGIKKNWIESNGKIPLKYFLMLHKALLSYCSNLKFSTKVDFALDQFIIESIDKITDMRNQSKQK